MSVLTAYDKFIQQALKYGFTLFGLPWTGQTISYAGGDDGDYEKGFPGVRPIIKGANSRRFVLNGDGTTTDLATGLLWVSDPINAPGAPFNAAMTWANALINCEALNFAGYTDWRLPNAKELASILDYANSWPPVDATFFPNYRANDYWTSTTYKSNTLNAWLVENSGAIAGFNDAKTNENWVRPVRLGLPA